MCQIFVASSKHLNFKANNFFIDSTNSSFFWDFTKNGTKTGGGFDYKEIIQFWLEVLHPRRGAPYVNLICYSVDPMK